MQPLETGDPRTVGAYQLLGRLGVGGMGRVFVGRSAGGRTVAVKVVHPHFAADDEFRERFRREVNSARRVGGSWTAPVLDAGPEDPVPWVATGYVAGPALQQAVGEHGPLPEQSVRVLGTTLAEALRHVHGLGLVHRDVKPSNVLLALDGPRLIDFGIVRATDGTPSVTSSGVSVGSPGYMSPEQVLGSGAGFPADLFSLGAVLAYAATGEPPFPGDSSAALLYKVVHEQPHLPGLHGDLYEAVTACLAKSDTDRPTPDQLIGLLAGAEGVAPVVQEGWLPAPIVEQVSRWAVQLLDLEPAPRQPDGEPQPGPDGGSVSEWDAPSGPVPFTHASEGPGETGASAGGVAGPRTQSGAERGGAPGGSFGPPPAAAGSPPGHATEGGPSPGTAEPDGKVAVLAGKTPAGNRKLSCTLVVSLACVLVGLTLGGYFLDLLPGTGDGGASGAKPPPGKHHGAVAEGFLGSWEGDVHTRTGTPNGRVRVTVRQGEVGRQVATSVADFPGTGSDLRCSSKATLQKATADKLTLTDTLDGRSPKVFGIKVCAEGSSTLTLTRAGKGHLRYASQSEGGGKPKADLTRRHD